MSPYDGNEVLNMANTFIPCFYILQDISQKDHFRVDSVEQHLQSPAGKFR